MKDRSIWTLALVAVSSVLVAIGLAACGGGDSSGSESNSGQTSGEDSADISGKVTVWDFEYKAQPAYTEAVDEIDANFEKKHPGVTVERVAQPGETYEAQIRSAFTSHEVPDVMLMQPGAGTLNFTKALEPLNDRITPEMEKNVSLWEFGTPGFAEEGERFGVPIGVQGLVYYYNKKLFAKAGLPTDFHPQTWAELREAGEKLKQAGITAFSGGGKGGSENIFWFSQGWEPTNTEQQGIELFEGEIPWTDPIVTEAFQPQAEMVEAGLFGDEYFGTDLYGEGWPGFSEEKGAMTLGFWNSFGAWFGPINEKLGEKNVGIFQSPGAKETGVLTAFNMSIPTEAKNKDAAWALVEYTQSKEGMEILDEVGGMMPNRTDVSLPPKAPIQEKELLELTEESPTRVGMLALVPFAVDQGPMRTPVNEALQGRTSFEDAQAAIQETVEKTAE